MTESPAIKKLPTFHWFCYTIGYSFICFLACLLLASPQYLPFVTVVAITIATITLSGIWSAYGTGNVLPRCLISIALTVVVGLGIALGVPSGITAGVLSMLMAIPAFCCASQATHWLFRIAFGWQFVVGENEPLPTTFSIRELLVVTMLVAVSIAGIRVAATLFLDTNPQLVSAFEEVETTESDWDESSGPAELKQQARESAEQLISLQLAIYAGVIGFISFLMTVPLLLVFYPKDFPQGITWFAVVIAGYLGVWVTVNFAFGFGASGVVNILFLIVAATGIAFTVPLIHTRALGVSLKLRRQSVQA